MLRRPMKRLILDSFALRQFGPESTASPAIRDATPEEFEDAVNAFVASSSYELRDGYAPFCKHVFVPNTFLPSLTSTAREITPENRSRLRSAYEARTSKELAVLVRYFVDDEDEKDSKKEKIESCAFLDVILYSRDQIVAENESTGTKTLRLDEDWDWGIISVKAQDVDTELPMTPMTMLRNALGKEEGGSGVPLDKAKYDESVAYWDKHAVVKPS